MEIRKYPRTRHLEGSRLQVGDAADDKSLAELAGQILVVEEKIDGANCAVSFDQHGQIMLQSRGHYLTGGGRERHFDLLKTWSAVHAQRFYDVLGSRYIMYGEWMFAKHTVFYDRLPHFFMEFDVYDRDAGVFLSTEARRGVLRGLPVMPVPVVYSGTLDSMSQIDGLIRPSLYISSDWQAALRRAALGTGSRLDMVDNQTDDSGIAEGLYVKQEADGFIEDRFKFVRGDFLQTIQDAEGHWLDRPIIPNELMGGVDIFAPVLGLKGAYDDPAL